MNYVLSLIIYSIFTVNPVVKMQVSIVLFSLFRVVNLDCVS